jgi:hypothetical protein
MPKKKLPRIRAASAANKGYVLNICWDHGEENPVDVSGLIENFRVFAPLRKNRELFRRVRVGPYGTDIVWTDDIDMVVDTLWRLAQEQSGATMTADAFRSWRQRKAYTLEEAAKALGISRRMVAYYDQGDKPIPRVVALATRALEGAERQ